MSVFDWIDEVRPYIKSCGRPVLLSMEMLSEICDFIDKRRWNKTEYPPNEQEVLIIIEHRYPECKPVRSVTRAFYEDGSVKLFNSDYGWDLDVHTAPMDEDGDLTVPRGWYELNDYGDGINVVTDGVIAWQQVPDQWEGEDREDVNT